MGKIKNALNISILFLMTIFIYIYLIIMSLIIITGITYIIFMLMQFSEAGIGVKILISSAISVYALWKTLWIKVSKPIGVSLDKNKSNEMFRLIEDVRKKTNSPGIREVIINDEYSVEIVQVPIFGVFGITRKYLVIGLPLMIALTSEELEIILTREFQHISRKNHEIGKWVYNLRKRCSLIKGQLGTMKWNECILITGYVEALEPFYMKYSFDMSRKEELSADEYTAKIYGTELTGETIINAGVRGEYLVDSFWEGIYEGAFQTPNPPDEVFMEMEKCLWEGLTNEKAQELYSRILRYESSEFDPHPAIKERLASINYKYQYKYKTGTSAFRELLGEGFQGVVDIFNSIWKESNKESWKEKYSFTVEGSKRLIELRNITRERDLNMDEGWEVCYLTEALYGGSEALQLYTNFLAKYPDFLPANFATGRLYLKEKNPDGIELIEKAISGDIDYVMDGLKLIHDFYFYKGEVEEANKYYRRALEFAEILEKSRVERSDLGFNDIYMQHRLSKEEIENLVNQMSQYDEIEEIYIVRKETKYFSEKQLYAVGIVLNYPWYSSGFRHRRFVEKISQEVRFSGETLVVFLNRQNVAFKKRMGKIPNSKIYSKK